MNTNICKYIVEPIMLYVCIEWQRDTREVINGQDKDGRHMVVSVLKEVGFPRSVIIDGTGFTPHEVDYSTTWQTERRKKDRDYNDAVKKTARKVARVAKTAGIEWAQAFALADAARGGGAAAVGESE